MFAQLDVEITIIFLSQEMKLKGACSAIFGKLIFFKLADMATFPTKTSYMVKK